MLPDYPQVKRKLGERLNQFLQHEIHRHAPLLADIPKATVHEGHDWSMRPIGAEEAASRRGYERHEAEMTIPNEVFRQGDMEQVKSIYSKIAEQLAEQQSRLLLERVSEAADRAGNVIRGPGGLTKETFLEVFERIHSDFDPDTGEVKGGMLVMHPDMAEKFVPMMAQWEQDSEFMAELRRIKAQKWIEWRDRESRRRLVD